MKNNLNCFFRKILIDLKLEENPPLLLTGRMAEEFKNNYALTSGNFVPKGRVNGMFLYENLDESFFEENGIDKKYLKTGVICLFNERVETLAHEMMHAKQFISGDEKILINSDEDLLYWYKKSYVFYPCEKEAFEYAISFLYNNKMYSKWLFYLLSYKSNQVEYFFSNFLYNYKKNKCLV